MIQKRIKFKRGKLGRMGKNGLWGHADEYPLVIDMRCKGKKELEIYIHESLHYLFPRMEELEVIKKAILLTNTLWHEGYRKTDNDNNEPLQDGIMYD